MYMSVYFFNRITFLHVSNMRHEISAVLHDLLFVCENRHVARCLEEHPSCDWLTLKVGDHIQGVTNLQSSSTHPDLIYKE